MDETLVDIKNDKTYTTFHPVPNKKNTQKINPTSLDMHQITKLKQNSSFQTTADVYNACIRAPAGLPPIGYTAIYQAIKRSNHTVVRKELVPQSSNSNLMWVQARFQAASQLIVRFGKDYPEDTKEARVNDLKYINRKLLEDGGHTLVMQQVGWWDEKHIKQVVGYLRDHCYQFAFDEDGLYSPDIHYEIVKMVSYVMCIYINVIHKCVLTIIFIFSKTRFF